MLRGFLPRSRGRAKKWQWRSSSWKMMGAESGSDGIEILPGEKAATVRLNPNRYRWDMVLALVPKHLSHSGAL